MLSEFALAHRRVALLQGLASQLEQSPFLGLVTAPAPRRKAEGYDSHISWSAKSGHHDPRFYPEPEAFQPERWTEGFTKALHKFAYLPFGIGARRCIGALFAEAETMLAVASIVQRFQVRAVPNAPVTPVAATRCAPVREACL